MSARYRAAIIGLGRIASKLEKDPLRGKPASHAGFYQLDSRIDLVAGADIERAARNEFAADWNLSAEQLYPDYRQMLRQEQPNLVSICAYAPERLNMTLEAIECGAKGLWLEKALGCSLHEATAIADAVSKNRIAAIVDYPRRTRAGYRKIRKIIVDETFGKLQSVTCHMTHQLIHTGTHAFDVLRYWCGEAACVQGCLEVGAPETTDIKDQGGHATVEFENGTVAFISAYRKKYYIFQFDLVFENARILYGNDIKKVYLPNNSQHYSGFKELFETPDYPLSAPCPRNILEDLTHSMETGEEPICSATNAVEALKIGLAIFESHRRGKVSVDPQQLDPLLRVESV